MKILRTFCTGFVIGVANIIPGVSGGTMALVLGIYERLLTAINNISPATAFAVLGLLRFNKQALVRFREEMKKVDILFLIIIFAGAIVAIMALAQLMTYLLIHRHDPTYGFFFGLVFISVWAPYKLIKKKSASVLIAGLIAFGILLTFSYIAAEAMVEKTLGKQAIEMQQSQLSATPDAQLEVITTAPEEEKPGLSLSRGVFFFFAGAISISAMILPGISGSFVLLLMGGYFDMLRAIAELNWLQIIIFSVGCLLGLLLFTRLLSYLLKKFPDITMGFLVGLVLGSLYAIWPFKATQIVGGEVVYLNSILPQTFGMNEILTILTFIAGALIVMLFFKLEKKNG